MIENTPEVVSLFRGLQRLGINAVEPVRCGQCINSLSINGEDYKCNLFNRYFKHSDYCSQGIGVDHFDFSCSNCKHKTRKKIDKKMKPWCRVLGFSLLAKPVHCGSFSEKGKLEV